jgi:beta-mannosidase
LRNGDEVYQYFPKAHHTAYTEFGVPGMANIATLEQIIPCEELFPPRSGSYWQARHAFHAWDGSPDSWLELWCVQYYFGEPTDLEQLVYWSQWLQCEGLKCVFEEARRQKPVCAMALNWCFNEPWPNAANNSLLSWPYDPKPALKAVGQALRPVLASARFPKFSWHPGETMTADLFLLNDSPYAIRKGKMDVFLCKNGQDVKIMTWNFPGKNANENLAGPTMRFQLPSTSAGPIEIHLKVKDHPEWDSIYTLLLTDENDE